MEHGTSEGTLYVSVNTKTGNIYGYSFISKDGKEQISIEFGDDGGNKVEGNYAMFSNINGKINATPW